MNRMYCLPVLPIWITGLQFSSKIFIAILIIIFVVMLLKKAIGKAIKLLIILGIVAGAMYFGSDYVRDYWYDQRAKYDQENPVDFKGINLPPPSTCSDSFKFW